MKKSIQVLALLLLVVCSATAQQEKGIIGSTNWMNNWTEFKPSKVDYGEPNQILAGNITENTKLLKKNIYSLQGPVYVTNNAVLTIEPGTVIIGDFVSGAALVITKGATIIADGLETDPIVFTSNRSVKKAGDWGGLVILGDAPINKFGGVGSINYDLDNALTVYGGNNPAASSGILRYVRIEYAGKKVKGSGNFSGLFMGGVGNKTILENVMVSFCAGDAFEVYGGDVVMNKMVSLKTNGIDYKFNFGAQGKIDNSIAIRSSYISSNTGASRCFDLASYDQKAEVDFTKKQTNIVASNMTFVNDSDDLAADTQNGLIKDAVRVAENTFLELKRSVISGFNPAVVLDAKIDITVPNLKKVKLEQLYINYCKGNIFTEFNPNNEELENWYGNSAFFNVYDKKSNADAFLEFFNEKRPDFRLKISKITASNNN
ncbi:hypothetical protein ACSVH5_10300 [Flavobacterium sp. RSSA_27]|uniref:hypothetical protein n=1 Tax=Flavobacterium sp. RSSA_27 TaxID=3447667 RepID=UPI003F2EA963